MGFRLKRRVGSSSESPESLFRDLRNRSVEGLLSQQADMLRAYMEHETNSDVALQMPTGSGKTLVGLLIAEWRRRKFRQQVLYLCPTRQLVNQVVEQAVEKYGIRALSFTGSKYTFTQADKSEYENAEVLGVTTYSGLFNTNPYFDSANTIILDDIHAAENYVSDFWSLQIRRGPSGQDVLFNTFISILKDHIPISDYTRLTKESVGSFDTAWINKIPTPIVLRLHDEIVAALDNNVRPGSDLFFKWTVLRDHLQACHIYFNSEAFLIRPLIPPTNTHFPFSNAEQRVYMSATLGEGGELERLTGKRNLVKIPAPEGWERQGVGRRFFIFPMRSLEEDDCMVLITALISDFGRALILTPSEKEAEKFREIIKEDLPDHELFQASQIEYSKKPFVSKNTAVAVVANRYDGIDLVGDECRLLVVSGLPDATNLQERFLITRMGASILYNDRIITRITQATGRCTRSATDYASVIVLGEKLNKFLMQSSKRIFFHPELQAEIEFGIEESKDRELGDFLVNCRTFLTHGKEWQPVDDTIVEMRDELERQPLLCVDEFIQAVKHEINYQYSIWNGDYTSALESCRQVLAQLVSEPLRGYRAFWLYLAGSAAWIASEKGDIELSDVARDYFGMAAKAANSIPWLSELTRLGLSNTDTPDFEHEGLDDAVEKLESQMENLGTIHDGKFERYISQIVDGLSQTKANKFEKAQVLLGNLLGYEADNSSGQSAPDPWWILSPSYGLVFEDYSDCNEDSVIPTRKVRQAASHPQWLNDKPEYQDIEFRPIFVTPSNVLDVNAVPFSKNVFYWSTDDFRKWANEAISVIRTLRRIFPGPGDLVWRADAKRTYIDKGLNPKSILEHATKRGLADLPTS